MNATHLPHIILFDREEIHSNLLPLTFTRPVSQLLCGMHTLGEKWAEHINGIYSHLTVSYLSNVYPCNPGISNSDTWCIAGNIIASPKLTDAIISLPDGHRLTDGNGNTIALHALPAELDNETSLPTIIFDGEVKQISSLTDIFTLNASEIENDFQKLKASDAHSAAISSTCTIIGSHDMVFIAENAIVEGATLNTTHGPIYIGVGCEVMEGATLRGPIALLEHSTVNMGTRIYPGTTIGAHCKVGGELNNVVMHPYSNKAHDGFLGNAVIGSWCNLGAGCVASNLKNDYTEIKLWNYPSRRFLRTGLQFCGLIMGDHSKAGINTMFNTATVIGVGVNIHGTGFPRNFVASFQEGSASTGFYDVPITKFLNIARRVMARRDLQLSEAETELFETLHHLTESYK